MLIVCEGSKTEPNYLREFIAHHQLSSANIRKSGCPVCRLDLFVRTEYLSPECNFVRLLMHATSGKGGIPHPQ